jgi:hypothetical protein
MRTVIVACAIAAFWPTAAIAQVHRFYVSALGGIDAGARGPISGGSLPTIGGTAGLRLSEGWSLEAEIERGFHTQERSGQGLWFSRAAVGATREEIERNGVYARFDRAERTELGWSAVAVWTSRSAGRLNGSLFGGVSSRRFAIRTRRTVTSIGPGVDPSPTNPDLQPGDETRAIVGGGLTGGFRVLMRLTPTLTAGPEIRYTFGLITDDYSYSVVRLTGRLIWSF